MKAGFSPTGMRWYGLCWLADAVQLSRELDGRNGAKRWARDIREALKEAPKKHRQNWARELAKLFRYSKISHGFKIGGAS